MKNVVLNWGSVLLKTILFLYCGQKIVGFAVKMQNFLLILGLSTGLFVFLCLGSYAHMTFSRIGRLMRTFTTVSTLPLIGSLHLVLVPRDKILGRLTELLSLYGQSASFWLGHYPFVGLTVAKDIEKVLSTGKHLNKGKQYDAFRWCLKDALLTSDAEWWKQDRKVFGRFFRFQKHETFVNAFNKHSKKLLQVIDKKYADASNFYDVHSVLFKFSLDVISETVVGRSFNAQSNLDVRMVKAIHLMMELFIGYILKPWTQLPIVKNITGTAAKKATTLKLFDEVLSEEIVFRRRLHEKRNGTVSNYKFCKYFPYELHKSALKTEGNEIETKQEQTIFDVLLETKPYTQIKDHFITFVAAGADSTSVSMSLLLYLFALHPEWQKKVQDELDSIFCESPKRDVTLKDLTEMKYAEMVIKESLRIYTPASVIMREANEDIYFDNDRVIPKGCNVAILIHHLHRDPIVFPDPEVFNPNRFNFESPSSKKFTQYEFMPFSAGSRNCIGWKYAMLEIKTAAAYILREYNIFTNIKREDLKINLGMFIEVPEGVPLRFKKRSLPTNETK